MDPLRYWHLQSFFRVAGVVTARGVKHKQKVELESERAVTLIFHGVLAVPFDFKLLGSCEIHANRPDLLRIQPRSEIWFWSGGFFVLATINMQLVAVLSMFSPLWKRSLCPLLR